MGLQPKVPEVRAALDLIEAYMAEEWQDSKVPGLSAAIVADRDVIWAKGYGQADLEKQRPATAQTVYRLASITKLFTATMLMQLRDAGKLHLDDPVTAHVPEFQLPSRFADASPPTLGQLVSHTAGLPREAPLDYWDTMRIPPIEALLASLANTDRSLPPTTEFKYSNLGIAVLAHALERVAGQPYVPYVAEHILRPLGMGHSGFDVTLTDVMRERLAQGYRIAKDKPPEVARYLEEGGMNPVGGLYSSVEDMVHFISLQFRDGPEGGAQILRAATLREMHAPVFMNPDWKSGVGIGWMLGRLLDRTTIGHGGGIPGYRTDITLVPDLKLGVAVFTNSSGDPNKLARSALEVLLPVAERARAREEAAQPMSPLPDNWQHYVGHYRLSHEEAEIAFHDGKLVLLLADQQPRDGTVLLPEGARRFRMKGGGNTGELVISTVDEAGNVTELRFGAAVARRAGQ